MPEARPSPRPRRATLYAKVPGELMQAMKLHLLFNPEEKDISSLVAKRLSASFEKELEEVRSRGREG